MLVVRQRGPIDPSDFLAIGSRCRLGTRGMAKLLFLLLLELEHQMKTRRSDYLHQLRK